MGQMVISDTIYSNIVLGVCTLSKAKVRLLTKYHWSRNASVLFMSSRWETQLPVLKEESHSRWLKRHFLTGSCIIFEQKQTVSRVHPPPLRTREAAHLLLSVRMRRTCARSLRCSSTRRTFRLIERYCVQAVPLQNPVDHSRTTEDKTLHLQALCTGDTQKSNQTLYHFITRTWNDSYVDSWVSGVKILESRNQIELRKHFSTWINCVTV